MCKVLVEEFREVYCQYLLIIGENERCNKVAEMSEEELADCAFVKAVNHLHDRIDLLNGSEM